MKKLIVAVAIALAGMAVNAAACSWAVGKIYTPSTTDLAPNPATGTLLANGTATLYYALALDGDSTVWSVLDSKSVVNGAVAKAELFNASTLPSDIADNGNAAYFKAIIETTIGDVDYTLELFPGKNVEPAVQSFATLSKTAVSLSFTGVTSTTASKEWAANVPEPTSGLMLLLGMAGLALKRKRG